MGWQDSPAWGFLYGGAAVIWVRLLWALCRERRAAPPHPEHAAPAPVQLIIPCTDHPRLVANLSRFAVQEHPSFHLTLVTASRDEPAASVCRRLAREHRHCDHVVAGAATGRGQKNHNLIAGVRAGRSRRPEVLVFCDDDCAPPDAGWLARFARRAAAAPDRCVTTFRRVMLGRSSPGSYLYYCSTGFQRSAVALTSRFVWGGATALAARTFDALGVERAWGRTVVDDVVLASLCSSAEVGIDYAACCLLEEAGAQSGPRAGFAWLVRQLQFLRYHALPALLALLALLGATALATVYLLDRALLGPGGSDAVAALAAICAASASSFAVGVACAHGGPPGARHVLWCVAAGGALVFVALVAALRALLGSRIAWCDRDYVMSRDGEVLRVEAR